jgi:hypothetical protein
MMNLVDVIVYLAFYLFVIVVGYQYIRERNLKRLIGLIAILIIVVLYTLGKIFFPRSPFAPTILPPVGLLGCIYYLTYPRRRNRVLAVLLLIFIVVLIGAYLNSAINH